MTLNSQRSGRSMIPHRSQLTRVVQRLRVNPNLSDLNEDDDALPYRPGLPLKQLNALFSRCHNKIRNLEKDEDSAFADFSKLLFLRLLEEKADESGSDIELPYSSRFHDLAARSTDRADEVKTLVDKMIDHCRQKYGDVITEGLKLRQPKTYMYLVAELSKVSFTDSGLDTKGAAFEYFVRATLKGKKLGQYFTPRQLVYLMLELVGRDMIVNSASSGEEVKVLDPACGTGGFIVFLMKDALEEIDRRTKARKLTADARRGIRSRIMERVFYGMDANSGVASSAKMNMIVSGDGHTNIRAGNSLSTEAPLWSFDRGDYDLIISNPPFGTSESDLGPDDLSKYPVKTTKGQLLFLQRMVLAAKPRGIVCTVIDDGALNTDTAAGVRRWILENCRVQAVLSLPATTFKPNKITVKSSVLLLQRLDPKADDPEEDYPIVFCSLASLGYHPSGEPIRGFDFQTLRTEFSTLLETVQGSRTEAGEHWRAFAVQSTSVSRDGTNRLDFKYWDARVREKIDEILAAGGATIGSLNAVPTGRGKSPAVALYVDPEDGYARVLKAGSSTTAFGEIVDSGDWVEKATYDELPPSCKVQQNDVLLASTGDGTLGKAGVYTDVVPAIADGHITVIRTDPERIDPFYLADYLRCGFGRVQSDRLYVGSTGLIELTPAHVDQIVVPLLGNIEEQKAVSSRLRAAESSVRKTQQQAEEYLQQSRAGFRGFDLDIAATAASVADAQEDKSAM
jgi:type I restriction enzyme M protein